MGWLDLGNKHCFQISTASLSYLGSSICFLKVIVYEEKERIQQHIRKLLWVWPTSNYGQMQIIWFYLVREKEYYSADTAKSLNLRPCSGTLVAYFADIAKSLNLRPCSGTLVAQMIKRLPVMWEIWVQSLGQEDPPETEMATRSSTLAWRIPWREDLVGSSSWVAKESDLVGSSLRVAKSWTRMSDFTCYLSGTTAEKTRCSYYYYQLLRPSNSLTVTKILRHWVPRLRH